jgi:hypothetical protein
MKKVDQNVLNKLAVQSLEKRTTDVDRKLKKMLAELRERRIWEAVGGDTYR